MDSYKSHAVIQLVQKHLAHGEKSVVFGFFNDQLFALGKELKDKGLKPVVINGMDGGTKKRADNIQQWRQGQFDVALVNIMTGVGFNLNPYPNVPDKICVNIFLEYNWTPLEIIQSRGRILRCGSEYPVTNYYLICQGSYDESMFNLIQKKNATIQMVLRGETANGKIQSFDLNKIMEDIQTDSHNIVIGTDLANFNIENYIELEFIDKAPISEPKPKVVEIPATVIPKPKIEKEKSITMKKKKPLDSIFENQKDETGSSNPEPPKDSPESNPDDNYQPFEEEDFHCHNPPNEKSPNFEEGEEPESGFTKIKGWWKKHWPKVAGAAAVIGVIVVAAVAGSNTSQDLPVDLEDDEL